MQLSGKPQLCYVDVGGTFTDAIVVADDGSFTLAKALSTPDAMARGFFNALGALADEAGCSQEELVRSLSVLGYGSTIVLNTLLTRTGARVGLIVTRGFEDLLLIERGKQTWIDYERIDRIHPVTHRHRPPLVPKSRIRGVTERVDCFGRVVIPLYEHEVREAVADLCRQDVEGIAICLLWSFLNDSHERRVVQIAHDVMSELGVAIPVYASVEVSPVMRELSRANAVIIEAYTSRRLSSGLTAIQRTLGEQGFKGEVQVMQSAGGLASVSHVKAVETVHSGPVGGVIGGRFIARQYGLEHVITSDVGGTSFDVSLITSGHVAVNREPSAVGYILGVPMVEILSIGAGGGTLASIDPLTGRLQVGPESAGADPGPACFGRGGAQPTVTDADLVLGYINPRTWGGGRVPLDTEAARTAIQTHVAEPLGVSVEEAAMGIKRIIDVRMADTIKGLVAARGFDLRDYSLLAFGGAGPTHVVGYTEELPLAGVLVFPYSSVFSAFGASCADYQHHYTRACNIIVPPFASDDAKMAAAEQLNRLWMRLAEQAVEQMEQEGFSRSDLILQPQAMIRYGRQLNDLIVPSPVQTIRSPSDFDRLIAAFEGLYERIYARAARFPQSGFDIFEVGLIATAPKICPRLPTLPAAGPTPSAEARLGSKPAWFDGGGVSTPRFAMRELRPENEIVGPAVVEDPTTTLVLPPGFRLRADQHLTMWLTKS